MASHGSSFQKTFMGAAGSGGAGLDVTDVFSTNLYTGNNSALTVNTGLDQNTEGGMLWVKSRSTGSTNHGIWDTERTNGYYLPVNLADNGGNISAASGTNPFLRDGSFRWNAGHGWFNQSGNYVAWAFRKAEKFFDVVTYTGDGNNNRSIAHNLGSVPGMIIIKMISGQKDWKVYHRGLDSSNPENYKIHLNETAARSDGSALFDAPTATHFILDSNDDVNGNGDTHVAYLFANNDSGDGGFGPDGDQDIIKCGTYTGNGNNTGPVIDLGFEPQWLLIKNFSDTDPWLIFDNMRKFNDTDNNTPLIANSSDSESNDWADAHAIEPTATGFKLVSSIGYLNNNNNKFIYMAIRRGPLAPPEAATEVFAIDAVNSSTPFFTSGFPVDMAFYRSTSGSSTYVSSRLTGLTEGEIDTNAAFGSATGAGYDIMTGVYASDPGSNYYGWMWKRAPSYFDVVAYTGTGSPNAHAPTLSHNLTVPPEMVWVKKRSGTGNWAVSSQVGTGGVQAYLDLNNGDVGTLATTGPSNTWADYFTATQVIGNGGGSSSSHSAFPVTHLNVSGATYIMILFATLAGISKVGSVTHSGSSTDVNCGFSNGARFVMLKRYDAGGGWYIWDTVRGIIANNDPYLLLDTDAAAVTNTDFIDPLSSGFTITGDFTDGTYIFYAIA